MLVARYLGVRLHNVNVAQQIWVRNSNLYLVLQLRALVLCTCDINNIYNKEVMCLDTALLVKQMIFLCQQIYLNAVLCDVPRKCSLITTEL